MGNLTMLAEVTLEDKYTLDSGRVYLTGVQALVRLALLQRQQDMKAGLDTAGYVSGYRGSPLGGFDLALARAKKHLDSHRIVFQPGVNEDLAATAIWGSQQLDLVQDRKYDGVFSIWYGKGPGVDRCGDVFRHANAAGTAKHGGVLALAGDDHGAKSSTQAAQSDFIFKAVGIPILSPASVQDIIDLGLHGIAMSRYSGCWVALKCVTDIVESSASIHVGTGRVQPKYPDDFPMPAGGLNIRWPEYMGFLEQENRLYQHKLFAAMAYARANRLDRQIWPNPDARFGIVTSGKAYNDVRQALEELGIDEEEASRAGIRLYKVAMPWPLEPLGIAEFARGLEEILVVEEKRQLIEYQIKEQLYNLPDTDRPRVVGKFSGASEWNIPQGSMLLPTTGELTPEMVARVLAGRIGRFHSSDRMQARLESLLARRSRVGKPASVIPIQRVPYFCSGCPHNTSTRVPEGSRALAGIGCHYMAQWMPDRRTATFSHMGGEGAAWCGQFPFSGEKHVFANLGDGTYYHSGLLAIRFAVAAKAPITYKILFNDAVAMTGGQKVDGPLTVPMLVQQVASEGVERVVVVTDEPQKYDGIALHAPVRHRDDLDAVQRELRDWSESGGTVSVLIYDQTCAAEKRRRRKRGTFPDPVKRAFINERVCEGCGDCGEQSNCVSIEPLETEFGRKRTINQSSCNKDYSCVKGFCPSFVTVEGGSIRKGKAAAGSALPAVSEPALPGLSQPYGLLVTGIGGTGVVTIGQILGMAAHIEQKGVSVLDVTGLAQKNGAVMSHVRIAPCADDLYPPRIAVGGADTVIGCDIVVSSGPEALSKIHTGRTRAVVNRAQTPTADFTHKPDLKFPQSEMEQAILDATGPGGAWFIDASRLATSLLGNAIATNMFMLGYAWQKGLIPLSKASILRAIELNEVSVEANIRGFSWGRVAAHDPAAVEKLAMPENPAASTRPGSGTLDELVSHRAEHLTSYQDSAYGERYQAMVGRVRTIETQRTGAAGKLPLTHAVARSYAKLLAYKDEYEVARLYAEPGFTQRIEAAFEGDFRLKFHLAPPLLAKPGPITGEPRKMEFGPWMMTMFRLLTRLKFLRGTAFDPFGRTGERRAERQAIADYESTIEELLAGLGPENVLPAAQIASLPEDIRGFGHVKLRSASRARTRQEELLAGFRSARAVARAA